MLCLPTDAPVYEQMELTVVHTFITLQCLDNDDSQKLRRNKSEPSLKCDAASRLPCFALTPSFAMAAAKCMESATPTTCCSANGDGDDSSQEDGASRRGTASSFSSSDVSDLPKWPEVLVQEGIRNYKVTMAQSDSGYAPAAPRSHAPIGDASLRCATGLQMNMGARAQAVLSTCPPKQPASTTCRSSQVTERLQNISPVGRACHRLEVTEEKQGLTQDWQAENECSSHTTLMVRNLPVELSQQDFVQYFIDRGYGGLFDFVYMPMNLRKKGNFGYAFINLSSHALAVEVMMQSPPLESDQQGESWMSAWSTCQGVLANIERYRNSPLMHDTVPMESRPALYNYMGDRVRFPQPTKSIPKPRIHYKTDSIQ